MKRTGLLFTLICRWMTVMALCLGTVAGVDAATLYERSMELFAARAKQYSPDDYCFVFMGDSRVSPVVFRKALILAAKQNPLFILHGGDVSDNGSRPELDAFLATLTETVPNLPVFVVVGNHERDQQLFREMIGPLNFTIDCARLDYKVIAVDNAGCGLSKAALNRLGPHLAEKRRTTFVAMHVPPRTAAWQWHTFTDGAAELAALLEAYRPELLLFSHVHQFARGEVAGVPALVSGGAGAPLYGRDKFPGEPVHHVVLVRVRQGRVTTELLPLL
jgi:3',5'-cyclic-AMP phosphodiesterase